MILRVKLELESGERVSNAWVTCPTVSYTHLVVVIKEIRALSTQTICVVMVKDNGVHGTVLWKRIECLTSAAVMVQHV